MLRILGRCLFRDINPNQFQIDSRYRSHLFNHIDPFQPAIDFVFYSKVAVNSI